MRSETGSTWSEEELRGIDLGDERLNKRVIKLAGQLAEQPQAYINQACEDWADVKAAYRFLDNEKVNFQAIISTHRKRVVERMRGREVILAIQDTTEIDYTSHEQTTGLGEIGNGSTEGLLMHTTLALTTEGLPLGLLSLQLWARQGRKYKEKYHNRELPITDKESKKWLEGLSETIKFLPQDLNIVTVCDREADIFEFMLQAQQNKAAYIVRAVRDRTLMVGKKKLWQELQSQPVAGRLEVEVAGKNGELARTATVSVRYAQVKIKPPQRSLSARIAGWKAIKQWAIYVKEIYAPQNATPLEWMLLTNLSVNSFEMATELINWYAKRWAIEVFHKVLKSGCKVESCLLQTAERQKRYLALMSIIAWRLFWLTHINRQNPEQCCTTILTDAEWQALYCRINKTTQLPKQPPTVYHAVRWIAKLGGFLGRKNDGEPGITVIWRGWQRLIDIVDTWLILHPLHTCG